MTLLREVSRVDYFHLNFTLISLIVFILNYNQF